GTLAVNFGVCGLACGLVVGNAAPLGLVRAAWFTSAGTSPATEVDSVPSKPGCTATAAEPAAPVPVTSAGALTATGRTAIWLCTVCTPSAQSSAPNAYRPNAAVVRVNVTWYERIQPEPITSWVGLTVTLKPDGAVTVGRYTRSSSSVLVTHRVTVWLPTRSPTAMFGVLRSLGSMLPNCWQAELPSASCPL